MNYKGYKDLECNSKAGELKIFIAESAKKIPAHKKFLLHPPIIDCSVSITGNIAESCERYTFGDTRNFFIISRGSTTETMEQSTTAFNKKHITEEDLKTGKSQYELEFKLINGYIAYVNKLKKQAVQLTNPITNS